VTERGPRRYESAASLQSRPESVLALEERLLPFDDQMFVGVYDAVKRLTVALEGLAVSTEQDDQTAAIRRRRAPFFYRFSRL